MSTRNSSTASFRHFRPSAILGFLTAMLLPIAAGAQSAAAASALASTGHDDYVRIQRHELDLPAMGIGDDDLDDRNQVNRNWILGLGSAHNFSWGASWAPPPVGTPASLAAFELNLGLKAVPPVLEAPPLQAFSPAKDQCSYDLTYSHNQVERYSDYLGLGPAFKPGQPRIDNDWGPLGTPSIFHWHTKLDVSLRLNGRPFGLAEGTRGAGVQNLEIGRHIVTWEARNLITPILDMVPWFVLGMNRAADGAKKTANPSTLRFLAKLLTKKSAIKFGPMLVAGAIGIEPEPTDRATVRTQGLWILDETDPTLIVNQPNYFVEALDVGGRVFSKSLEREIIENSLTYYDECGREVELRLEAPDFLPVGKDIPITWRALDPGPNKKNPASHDEDDPSGSRADDLRNETRRTQVLEIRDTLPPLLEPPQGVVVESTEARATVFLGKPGVFDIADPKSRVFPRVDNERVNRKLNLARDSRTEVVWTARDNSGNTSKKSQWVTVKTKGTNSRPRALDGSAKAVSFEETEIALRGQDDDLIDGRYDQLAFKISSPPKHGDFVAPLFPFFIEDYRVSATLPEGLPNDYYTESDIDGDGLLSKPELGALFDRWCEEMPREPIPRNFVTEPLYMSVNDKGETYVSDRYNVCTLDGHETRPRLARFDRDNNVIAEVRLSSSEMVESLFIDREGFSYFVTPSPSANEQRVTKVDPTPDPFNSGPDEPPLMNRTTIQFNLPKDDNGFARTWGRLQSVVVDPQGVMFVTDGDALYAFDPEKPSTPGASTVMWLGELIPQGGSLRDRTPGNYMDMTVDSEGNLYLSDPIYHRIWKYGPSAYDRDTGDFTPGKLIGWLGRCTGNLTERLACDTENQRSFGFRCTEETCAIAGGTRNYAGERAACGLPESSSLPVYSNTFRAGCEAGQLDAPRGLAMGPGDTLYVADFNNYRIQRFNSGGFFGGEAKSECDGTCFVLGDFGRPKDVTVNKENFYILDVDNDWLHVFETTPVTNVDDESHRVTQRAYVTYRSDNNFRGRDSFRFKTSDGLATSTAGSVTIDVSRNFRPPETIDRQPVMTVEDRAVDFSLAAVDPDGDEIRFRVTEQPRFGTLEGRGRNWTYVPDDDFSGEDSFVYVANDGLTSSPALESPPTTVSIVVEPVPDPPEVTVHIPMETGRGYVNMLRAEIYDPDVTDELRAVIDWGDGVVETVSRPPVEEGEPTLIQGVRNARINASHHYATNGNYLVRVCVSDLASSASLTSCNSADVTGLAATSVRVTDMVDLQLAVTEDLPKTVETECPPEVDDAGDCPLRSARMTDGQPVTYTVDVVNAALQGYRPAATGVEVRVEIPENFEVTAVSAGGPAGSAASRIDGDEVVAFYDALGPDDMGTLTIEGRTDGKLPERGKLRMIAKAVGDQPDPSDKNLLSYETSLVADPEGDADGDGFANRDDPFPGDPTEWSDIDGDGLGDNADPDDDNDLLPDAWEERYGYDRTRRGDRKADDDNDGLDNQREFREGTDPTMADTDLDRVPDGSDNCPALFNHDQSDLDGDGDGDRCDPDNAVYTTKLGDMNGNGTAELAILRRDLSGSWTVRIFDGATGESLSEFPAFGAGWTVLGLEQISRGRDREVLVLATRARGAVRAELFDPESGEERGGYDFFADGWTAVDFAVVKKLSKNVDTAIAVLARDSDGRNRVEIRRANNGELHRKTLFFNAQWQPRRLLVIEDINDDEGEELAVLAEHPDGRIASEIRTARSGFRLRTDQYFGEEWRLRDFASAGNANGRGAEEVALLAQRRDGRNAVAVRNVRSGIVLSEVEFQSGRWSASKLSAIGDLDGGGAREIAVVMQRDSGQIEVQVRDALDGTAIGKNRYLSTAFSPLALQVLPTTVVDRKAIAVIALRSADGQVRVEAREPRNGRKALGYALP